MGREADSERLPARERAHARARACNRKGRSPENGGFFGLSHSDASVCWEVTWSDRGGRPEYAMFELAEDLFTYFFTVEVGLRWLHAALLWSDERAVGSEERGIREGKGGDEEKGRMEGG
eukprot:748188-Rhodomonas_salina.1